MGVRSDETARLQAVAQSKPRRMMPPHDKGLLHDRALLHELQIHQIELEMQNEALRQSQSALEASRERYADLFDFAPVAYVTLSRNGQIAEANLFAASGLGILREELVGQNLGRFIAPENLESWQRHASAAWQAPGNRMQDLELTLKRADGSQFPALLHCMAMACPGGSLTMRIALFDNTRRSAAAAEMQRLAYYDSLTQLPNRHLFRDRLEQAVSASKRTGQLEALLFLDLDNFKVANDTHGHDAGDRLLIEVAHRLRSSLREGDTVARIGGDEFVMILEGLGTSADNAAGLARQVGEKMQQLISQRFDLGGVEFWCTTSIGVCMFGANDHADDLLRKADMALYQAKRAGRNLMRFFDPSA
jgi:diguanylate cyclase (GGDEF)-like protein/PAS domain S-box-containing protein